MRVTRPRRPAVTVAVVVLLVLGVSMGVLTALQRHLIYVPDRSPVGPAAREHPGGQDVTLHTDDGLDLTAWLLPPTTPAAGDRRVAVLVAPGNGGNRQGRSTLFRELTDRGLTVLSLEYRGYGGNPGSPSEEGLAADARAAVALLREQGFDAAHTVYLGESLGTGVLARLATTDPPAGLVLRSPFTSLVDVAQAQFGGLPIGPLLRDRYPLLEQLRDVRVPVTVIRGDADRVIDTRLSERVARSVPMLAEEIVLPGVDHNDPPMFGPRVAQAVADMAGRTVGRPGP